ncbi:MAG: hypothetical protein IPF75_16350 [Bacteroidetes bacterium]|nr:hypothetical protein [Bacteroidota bacterium]
MSGSFRKSDSEAEIEVGKFLDNQFYFKYVKNFQRRITYEEQMLGIDVSFDLEDEVNLLVDEKAMVHYVNKSLPTFAFEVSFKLATGKEVEGWLLDKSKLTQYYIIVWIWATKDKGFKEKDITKIELILVKRDAIIQMLEKFGFNDDKIKKTVIQIRTEKINGACFKDTNLPFYFYHSDKFVESPINIVIKKEKLLQIASAQHIISNKSHL